MFFIEGEYEAIEERAPARDYQSRQRGSGSAPVVRDQALALSRLLSARRAYKRFDPEFVIAETDLEFILRQASLSPSAFNIQHWRVVRVQRSQLRNELSQAAWHQKQIAEASEVLVVCADTQAWACPRMDFCCSKDAQERQQFAQMLRSIYERNPTLAREEALRSANLFAMSLMLAAESMGYQSCPMSGFNYPRVAELLQLRAGVEIAMIIAVGRGVVATWDAKDRLAVDRFTYVDSYAGMTPDAAIEDETRGTIAGCEKPA